VFLRRQFYQKVLPSLKRTVLDMTSENDEDNDENMHEHRAGPKENEQHREVKVEPSADMKLRTREIRQSDIHRCQPDD
jgi:hypothetical protein